MMGSADYFQAFCQTPPSPKNQSLHFQNLVEVSATSEKKSSESENQAVPCENETVKNQFPTCLFKSNEVVRSVEGDLNFPAHRIISQGSIHRQHSSLQSIKGRANFTEADKRYFASLLSDQSSYQPNNSSEQVCDRVSPHLDPAPSSGSHTCKCSEIIIVGGDDFANFPVIQVLKSLFNLKTVDQAWDSAQVISLFTDRVRSNCCIKRYKLVICDAETEGINDMVRTLQALTRVRINQTQRRRGITQSDISESYNISSLSQNSELNTSALIHKIQTKSQECAFVGLVKIGRIKSKNLNQSLIQSSNKPYLDVEAARCGFSEIVAKPLSLEVLTRLIETYLSSGDSD